MQTINRKCWRRNERNCNYRIWCSLSLGKIGQKHLLTPRCGRPKGAFYILMFSQSKTFQEPTIQSNGTDTRNNNINRQTGNAVKKKLKIMTKKEKWLMSTIKWKTVCESVLCQIKFGHTPAVYLGKYISDTDLSMTAIKVCNASHWWLETTLIHIN